VDGLLRDADDRPSERVEAGWVGLLEPGVLAALLWVAQSLYVVQLDIRRLVMAPWVPDDSFILMRIARNLALGRGYSFDGLTPTSGAPPLWIWLTSANHFFLGLEGAAKATLVESAFFGAASTLLVFVLARRLFNRTVAWTAFLLASFLAPLFFNRLSGMDCTLFTFLGLLAVWLYLVTIGEGIGSGRNYFRVGCLLGLVNLARADGVFLLLAVLVLEGFRMLRVTGRQRRICAVRVLALVAGTVLVTLPLVLLSLHASGSPLPTNQVGRRLISWERALRPDGSVSLLLFGRGIMVNLLTMEDLVTMAVGSGALALLSLVAGLVQQRGRLFTQLVVTYALTYLGTLVLYQWFFPDTHGLRYLNLTAHLLSISIAVFCYRVVMMIGRKAWLRCLIIGSVVMLLLASSANDYRYMVRQFTRRIVTTRVFPSFSEPEVTTWWTMVDWIAANIPEGTVLAASDHGVLAYFTEVRIVDLDGILDPRPIQAARRGTIATYLKQRKVEYVLLWPAGTERRLFRTTIEGACRLEPVADAPPGLYRLL